MGKLGGHIRLELDQFCRDTGYFNRKTVSQLMDSGNADQVWYLFNLALWWRSCIV